MDISLFFDKKNVLESVVECADFIEEIKRTEMYFYFPFDIHQIDSATIATQVDKDISNQDIVERTSNFIKEFDISAPQITLVLDGYCKDKHFESLENIIGILTPYGPYGFYLTPNTVYVNTSKGTSIFMLETFWHEVLHLVFENNSTLLNEPITEKLVDDTFIELFGSFFPDYEKQPVAELKR